MRKKTSRQRDSLKTAAPLLSRAAQPDASSSTAGPAGLLVAVELGAQFPTLSPAEGAPRRVLTQLEGESPLAFAERVTSSVEGAFGRGVALGQLALACNERLDDSAQAG